MMMKRQWILLLVVLGLSVPATLSWAAPEHPEAAAVVAQVQGDLEHAVDTHGGAAEKTPGLLTVEIGMIVWQVVLFVLLLAVLGKFVWPQILKGLQDRENRIRGDLEQAERAAAEANATLKQYQAQLADARKEAQRLIDQSRSDAQKVAGELKEQAQREIGQLRDRAQTEIRSAKEQAIAEIYEQTATLATQVAGRILQREISADDQRALVEESLNELTRAPRA